MGGKVNGKAGRGREGKRMERLVKSQDFWSQDNNGVQGFVFTFPFRSFSKTPRWRA